MLSLLHHAAPVDMDVNKSVHVQRLPCSGHIELLRGQPPVPLALIGMFRVSMGLLAIRMLSKIVHCTKRCFDLAAKCVPCITLTYLCVLQADMLFAMWTAACAQGNSGKFAAFHAALQLLSAQQPVQNTLASALHLHRLFGPQFPPYFSTLAISVFSAAIISSSANILPSQPCCSSEGGHLTLVSQD
jgi:hypothetical protein